MKYQSPIGSNDGAPYIQGNPAAGIRGSYVPAGAIEEPMRELLAVIAAAGIVPSDGDLTQVLQAIRALIVEAIPAPLTATEGVKIDAQGRIRFDVPDLSEEDSVADGDSFGFFSVADGVHRKISKVALKAALGIAASAGSAGANGAAGANGTSATPASTVSVTLGADQAVGNNVLASYPLTGLTGAFGTGDAKKFTFAQAGLYSIDALLQAAIAVNNNGAGGPVDTARAYSDFTYTRNGAALPSFNVAGTALNYLCRNTLSLSTTRYFAVGDTIAFAEQSTGDGYNANNVWLGGGSTFSLTRIA